MNELKPSFVWLGIDGFRGCFVVALCEHDGFQILAREYSTAQTARLQAGRLAKRHSVHVESDLAPDNAGG